MKRIPLQPVLAPHSLSHARKQNFDWSTYSCSSEGHQLRQAKAKEQQNFCGYCECRLTNDEGELSRGSSHIDHFFPRHKGPAQQPSSTFDWGNMILSCTCNNTCGIYKDRQSIPASDIIDPHHEDPRTFFTFVIEGERYVSVQPMTVLDSQRLEKAEKTIEALNLNFKKLQVDRYCALLEHKEEIECFAELFHHSVSDEFHTLRKLARELMASLESNPFSSTLVAYATAELKGFIED